MTGFRVSKELVENYSDYYNGDENEWRSISAIGKVDNIIKICSKVKHSTIIEIGAGEGAVLYELANRQFADEYYALEISSSGVGRILLKNISGLKSANLFDGYNIFYEDKSFDLAIMSHVLEHVEYPRKLINEAGRIAEYVYIEVPLEDNLRLSRDFVFDKVGHINYYSHKTIRRLIQSCNCKVIDQMIFNRPQNSFVFQKGYRGYLFYFIKKGLLHFSPSLATLLLTYHSGVLYTR